MRISSLLSLAAVCFGLSVAAANAGTATTTMNVTANLVASCSVSATDLAFGNINVLTTNYDAQTNVVVTCTPSTAYTIGMGPGANYNATSGMRQMGSGANRIGYKLYQDSARTTTLWGDGVTAALGTTLAGTGSGSAQTFPVYGRVPVQAATPAPGAYSDTLTVTVTY